MSTATKLGSLKIGDKIQHYCFGHIVEGEVIQVMADGVKTKHEPIDGAGQVFTETFVLKSLPLQMPISKTSPRAWHNGQEIII